MSLIGSFGALAGLYILLDSPFTAVTQIIVYAGAIMVLFLFVVMLLNVPREDAAEWDRSHPLNRPGARRVGAALAVFLLLELGWAVWHVLDARGGGLERHLGRRGQLGGGHRAVDLHRLLVPVRGDLDPDSGRRWWAPSCWRARSRSNVVDVTLNHYLVLSAILFAIGTAGVFLRRNVITLLLSIEIMLNAVNLTFVAAGRQFAAVDGQVIVFFVMTVAAAEAAVGLAIVIALFRHRESLNPEAFTSLKW